MDAERQRLLQSVIAVLERRPTFAAYPPAPIFIDQKWGQIHLLQPLLLRLSKKLPRK
jgi:hypothetical protein